ncbi:MAG: serine protease, partial [Candidatus Pacebacteria bacterium]|nr:serine protease [Candidatus Paceibacterota bacterium]
TEKVAAPLPKKPVPKPEPTPVVVPITVPVVPPTPVSGGNAALDAAAASLRASLVNIICYAPAGGAIHSISGSGVFIDAKGIILTNAHVAQYFLLSDRGVSCTIRAGSPAADSYESSLIYISPAWISANPTVLTQTAPHGTGEYDFALLAVTKSATNAPLPAAFHFVELAKAPASSGTPVVIATYGAQFLASSQVQSGLFPTIVFGSVKNVFTFDTNTIDVLALGGSAAAQEGSSGGGVADASGRLIGTITTSTVEGSTDTRSLDAITASYIRSEYASETGQPLDLLLERDPSTSAAAFAPQMQALEKIITANLP